MPSPLAHGLAGLTVHLLASRDGRELGDPWRIGVTVGAALIPDLDLAFKLVDGKNHHNDQLHSLGFALLAAVAGAAVFRLLAWRRPVALALAAGLAWTSHVLLDYLNVDTNPPIGLMALWPFSDAYYKSSVPVFLDIGRTLTWSTVRHDAVAGAWELVVLVPILLACWRYKAGQLGEIQWHVGSRARQ
jgi:inner membrane protein